MALPLVQLSYSALRAIISIIGTNRISGLMRELKVDRNTARKINETYNKVTKKGDITQKLGGKDVVSNKNTISVTVSKPQADILKSNPVTTVGGTGQRTTLNATTPNVIPRVSPSGAVSGPNVTAGGVTFPAGTNQGFLATMRDAGRQGVGFLASPTGIGLGAGGLLTIGAVDAMNNDQAPVTQGVIADDARLVTTQNPDGSTTTSLVSTSGGGQSYSDQVKSGDIKLGITEKSYKDFKEQLAVYNRNASAFDKATSSLTGDQSDPRNKPQFAEEAELYKLELADDGRFEIGLNAVKDREKQAMAADAPSFSLADARKAIATGGAGLDDDTPTPRFGDATGPNQFELVRGDDRNLLERTLGIGEEGVYVRKIYDRDSGTYLTPSPGDAGYQEFTESELASGQTTDFRKTLQPVNVGEDILNARGEVIGTQGPVTSTTVTPDITTQVVGPNGQTLIKDQTPMAGNISDQAQVFGLVNYLNNLAQNNNTFMGQNPGFNTGFFARPPMQQFYGTRQPGFFDREFYRGFF